MHTYRHTHTYMLMYVCIKVKSMTAMIQGTEGGNLDYFVIIRYSHYPESGRVI